MFNLACRRKGPSGLYAQVKRLFVAVITIPLGFGNAWAACDIRLME